MEAYSAIFLLAIWHSLLAPFVAGAPIGTGRVRPTDARIRYAFHQAAYRSSTFRRLLRELETSALIVYVTPGTCVKPDAAGCLLFQGAQGVARYVRIHINPAQPTDRLIVTLSHELQHALEVSRAADVVDESTFKAAFERMGKPAGSSDWVSYETQEAIDAGRATEIELKVTRGSHRPLVGSVIDGCETIERFCTCDRMH